MTVHGGRFSVDVGGDNLANHRRCSMGNVIIQHIAFDTDGRLRVYPSGGGDYSFIWRDASSARWDSEDHSLYVLPVKYFTAVDDLKQIVKAVRSEYGIQLVIDETTVFDVPEELVPQLRKTLNTTFAQLNHGWNAEPNAPDPKVEWRGDDLHLTFNMNAFQFPEYQEGDKGEIIFVDCSRYRLGTLNDEGWYRQQGRFCDVQHQWGEFYRVEGDIRLDRVPDDWVTRDSNTADRHHFLFYFRDEEFECDARDWELKVIRAESSQAGGSPRAEVEWVDEYRTLVVVAKAIDYEDSTSVASSNTAVAKMYDIVRSAAKEGPAAITKLAELLNDHNAATWLAHQLVECASLAPDVEDRCFSIVEELAKGDGPEAMGEQMWIEEWKAKRGRS